VLCRSDSRGRTESIAANLDQLGVVVAARRLRPVHVDRYLAGASFAGIATLLVVNKLDLPRTRAICRLSNRCATSASPSCRSPRTRERASML